MMKRRFFLLLGFLFAMGASYASHTTEEQSIRLLYKQVGAEAMISYPLFEKGVRGFYQIEEKRKPILTLVDFSKPSVDPRFFVIDMNRKQLLFSTHVSHGRNSGELYATSFSNVSGSNKSSLGFYVTNQTYSGRNGYSLRLDGLEEGINDKAMQRAIVVHGAKYANPQIAKSAGRLGRSLGCPALPSGESKDIIDTIKDGSVLFIYADDDFYLNNSKIV